MRASHQLLAIVILAALTNGCMSHQERVNADLFLAVSMGKIDDAERALKDGADIKRRDEHGNTVLHQVFLLIQEFRTYSQNSEADSKREESLKDFKREHIEAAKKMIPFLIKAGADVNAKDKYMKTPLMLAATTGDEELAFILIQSGADLRAKDNSERTAADYAFELKHEGLGIALRDLAQVQPTPTPPPTPPPTPIPTPAELKQRVLNVWGQQR